MCEADYVITSLANPAIFSAYPALELILNEAPQFQTFVDKDRLLQCKGDVGVRIVWVETCIPCFVVILPEHRSILLHSHSEAFFGFMHSHDKCARAARVCVGESVAMDAHKEVGLDIVCDRYPFLKRWVRIPRSRHDNFHVGEAFSDVLAQKQRHIQGDGFFSFAIPSSPEVARVRTAVPGIDDQNHARRKGRKRNGQHYHCCHGA